MGLRKIFSMLLMNQRGMSIAIHKRRKLLSQELSWTLNNTIKYGPFAGMIFSRDHWWGNSDRGAMLLGIYEQEILNSIMSVNKKYNIFIDLGAADGYYSIGSLISKKFKVSYAFEISIKGREVIQKNAILNKCSNKLHVFGEATKDFYKISTITTTARDLSKFPELFDYEDSDRWLIASEGRPKLMTWLRLDPK